jgi:hypothetical protein
VQVTGGQFNIVSQIAGPEAIGADDCKRF